MNASKQKQSKVRMKSTSLSNSLAHKVTSDLFDNGLGQIAFFAGAILVLVLSFWKLTRLDLTETELFFGTLLSLAVPLLCVLIGLVLPFRNAGKGS